MSELKAPWESRRLSVGYPTSEHPWEPIASPAHLIHGRDVLAHAQQYFGASGDHYLTVRIVPNGINSRPVLDDETMAELPLIDGVVQMRLVKLL